MSSVSADLNWLVSSSMLGKWKHLCGIAALIINYCTGYLLSWFSYLAKLVKSLQVFTILQV